MAEVCALAHRCNSTFLNEDADEGAEEEEEEESGESGESDEAVEPAEMDAAAPGAMKKPATALVLKRPAAKAAAPVKAAKVAMVGKAKVVAGKAAPLVAPPMKAMKAKVVMTAKEAKVVKKDKKLKIDTFIVPVGGKKPTPCFTPCHYKGGCIYWSKSKKSWRVYLRKIDKVEVSVRLGDDKETAEKSMIAKQWRKCLKAIEQDPRPVIG